MVGGLIGSASSDLKGETMAFWLTRAAMLAWVAVAATATVTGVAAAPDLPAAGSRSAAAASTVRIAPPPRPNPTVSVLVQPGEAFVDKRKGRRFGGCGDRLRGHAGPPRKPDRRIVEPKLSSRGRQ